MDTRHACPVHPETKLVIFCPACRGAAGGRKNKGRPSPRKGTKAKPPSLVTLIVPREETTP